MNIYNDILYSLLLSNDFLTKEILDVAQSEAKKNSLSLYEVLIKKDVIADENIGKILADHLKLPYIALSSVVIPPTLLTIVPERLVKKDKLIVFKKEKNELYLATTYPTNKKVLELIAQKTGTRLRLFFATERDILHTLRLFKTDIKETFDSLLKEQVDSASKTQTDSGKVTKIVDTLIEYAHSNSASDIHIEPGEEKTIIRFRIDGVLHDVLDVPSTLHEQIITRIKILSKLRTDEHLSAQDGKLQSKISDDEIDVRVSIVPIVEGEKAVLRLLSSNSRQYALSDLGMEGTDLEKIKDGFNKPYGMVLSTGPTGSGKTTSMYAILKILNTRDVNIATIEDPVEYDLDGLNQIQVNEKTNLTFAEGLRSILRQDPDIIYVGEIRDEETADIAINSAMTGHLVLSTLHTNDAATALPRLTDMNIEPFLVASTVNVIVAQRLVRKICQSCKVSYTESTAVITKNISYEIVAKHLGKEKEVRLFKGTGCAICHNTGYLGRIGIFEVLVMTDSLRELVTTKTDADVIAKKAVEEGMTTMLEDGLQKVQRGITTVEEILRATKE